MLNYCMVQSSACTAHVLDQLGRMHLQLKMFLPMGIMWAYNKVRLADTAFVSLSVCRIGPVMLQRH